MTGLLFFIFVSIFIIACASSRRHKYEEADKNSRKETKRQAKFKKQYWNRLKDKPVAMVTADKKTVFTNVWEASDVTGINATTVWYEANTEKTYTYEPKNSLVPIAHKFYWINSEEKW